MADPIVAPYGSWRSPITTDLLLSEQVGLTQIELDGPDVYWGELRPSEGGRVVVVRRTPDGQVDELTPQGFNVRSRVHEYGGGAFAVHNGTLYFVNYSDHLVYRQPPGGAPQAITHDSKVRHADLTVDAARGRLLAVREDHRPADREAINTLVSLDAAGAAEAIEIAAGNDFYSSPALSPDGTQLAWLTWNHPNLPWDGTELWLADLQPGGAAANARRVAGGPKESIFQPAWSPDGVLYFVSDRSGWWNLYRLGRDAIEAVLPMKAEFGAPQWQFGTSTYGFMSPSTVLCAYIQQGVGHLAELDLAGGRLKRLEMPYNLFRMLRVRPLHAVFLAASEQEVTAAVLLDVVTHQTTVLRRSTSLKVDPRYISVPQAIEFPTDNGLTAFAFYYPPKNDDYAAPPGELPPLIVHSHGGPTSAVSATFNPGAQYWTSRGFAIVDVNYGGSTGYGRAYRERLEGQWGVVDVQDCVNAARYLAQQGLADPERLIITGGSAGGYTTLCALTFTQAFKAGASYFGIGDLETFVRDTHKFESRYIDRLVGPYPERAEVYRQRSPIHFTDRITCPVIVLQGLDDKIVPPNQAEQMVADLRAKGLPFAYVAYPGEGHGFVRAENMKHSIESELYFYSRVFGFQPADNVQPIEIENLP